MVERFPCRLVIARALTIASLLLVVTVGRAQEVAAKPPLRIIVMDPLCKQLACACVASYAQRDYGQLATYLEGKLARPVQLVYAEALTSPQIGGVERADLIVGKYSLVLSDARQVDLAVRPLAMLSGADGSITQHGLFIVRQGDPAQSIENLAGYRLLFGSADADEKRSAALAALEAFDVSPPETIEHRESCSTSALAVVENEVDAAVVSSYAMPLLEGCGTLNRDELRIIGTTDPVPFIGLFVTDRVDARQESQLWQVLAEVRHNTPLLAALESQRGLVHLPSIVTATAGKSPSWTDWRGAGRTGHSDDVPGKLPDAMQLLWSKTMTGPGMSGLAVADGRVVVADKDLDVTQDIFRCLDADTGRERWRIDYPASGNMDFTNSPRANPVIHEGLAYLLGAFGDLHCVELATGRIVWRRNLAKDFAAEVPMWGYCSASLLVGNRLIVNPGATDAALVALNRHTGQELWRTAGRAPGYACFILARLGGREQVVGYDAASLGGWDPTTGQRLWELIPGVEGDFNVPTPIAVDGHLLVTTENNGTRLYGFEQDGRIHSQLLAANLDLAPDTSTPVVADRMVFGNFGGLMCLDLDRGLATLWEEEDDNLREYCTFIAGNGHLLVTTQTGVVYLLKLDKQRYVCQKQWDLFADVPSADREVWSHPALVGNRLYLRNMLAVYCFLID